MSTLENEQYVSDLTMAELENIVTQIVQRVVSKEEEELIPDEYKRKTPFNANATSFWQVVVENSHKIPEEIWDSIPSDASENFDLSSL